jgi:alkaline phosphatase D
MNTLLLFLIADFLYRGYILYPVNNLSFARLGFVDQTNSHIIIRHPITSNYTITYVSRDSKVNVEGFISSEEDYTSSVLLTELTPSTHYNYTTSLGHSGSFHTPPTTQKRFSFISSSCWKPFYPYNPLSHALSIPGLRYLDNYIGTKMDYDPDFVFFLGDFIYSDLPVQLAPYTREYYTKLFRQVYASPDWSSRLRNIPWLHMLDDHEFVNDFYREMPEGEVSLLFGRG